MVLLQAATKAATKAKNTSQIYRCTLVDLNRFAGESRIML